MSVNRKAYYQILFCLSLFKFRLSAGITFIRLDMKTYTFKLTQWWLHLFSSLHKNFFTNAGRGNCKINFAVSAITRSPVPI